MDAIQVDSVNVIGAAGDLRMDGLDGADFDSASKGYMIFGKSSTSYTCTNICTSHGLACSLAYEAGGVSSTCSATSPGILYCWCE